MAADSIQKMTKVPSPEELGMPEYVTSWRPHQEEGIEAGASLDQRVTAICAPTGSGKSELIVGTARLTGEPTCILTQNIGLQDQYEKRFSSIGLVTLKGRKNYTCSLKEDVNYTCEEGRNARCPYVGSVACPRSKAEMRAATSHIVCMNYDLWTSSKKYGQGFSHFNRLVMDEGHSAPDALARAMQVVITAKEADEHLCMDFPEGTAADDMAQWKQWAIAARPVAIDLMQAARQKLIYANGQPKLAWVRNYNHMKNLVKKLGVISTASVRNWISEQTDRGYQFDPIRPGIYAESTLLLRIPKIVIVSATLRPKTMYMLGIGKAHFNFMEFDSSFDPNRAPIYYVPTMYVKGLGQDLSPIWNLFDRIAARRRNVKGIAHTISYDRQLALLATSRFRDSFIINEKGEPTTGKVEEFKESGAGAIMVSPSIGTGYDFPDEYCRWNFVVKVPFEPKSKIQSARQELDKEYVYYRAMQSLVQAFGRDVRNDKDWSERFIGDMQMEWFKPQYSHLAPKSFHAVYKRVEILPPPLRLS